MAPSQGSNLGTLEPVGGGDPIPLLKERLVIGRRETSDICLRFSNVSTSHCELILEQGYWKVRDLQSTNGVKVNGERVLEKRVYPGDELEIAKHRYRLVYTPTTSRSADAEVDELHEDIMQFSLMERAGLAKRGDKAKTAPRRPVKTTEDDALEFLNTPTAQPDHSRGRHDADRPAKIAGGPGDSFIDEEQIETVPPATSAHDLSDEEFFKIVAEEQNKQESPKDKKQS